MKLIELQKPYKLRISVRKFNMGFLRSDQIQGVLVVLDNYKNNKASVKWN